MMRIRSARALLRSDFHDNRHMKPVEQIESEAVRAGKIRPPDIAYSVRPPSWTCIAQSWGICGVTVRAAAGGRGLSSPFVGVGQ